MQTNTVHGLIKNYLQPASGNCFPFPPVPVQTTIWLAVSLHKHDCSQIMICTLTVNYPVSNISITTPMNDKRYCPNWKIDASILEIFQANG